MHSQRGLTGSRVKHKRILLKIKSHKVTISSSLLARLGGGSLSGLASVSVVFGSTGELCKVILVLDKLGTNVSVEVLTAGIIVVNSDL